MQVKWALARCALFVTLTTFTGVCESSDSSSPVVKVSLEAQNIRQPYLIYEIGEWFASQQSTHETQSQAYDTLLSQYSSQFVVRGSESQSSDDDVLGWFVTSFLPSLRQNDSSVLIADDSLLTLSLSLHEFAPKMAMFQSLFQSTMSETGSDNPSIPLILTHSLTDTIEIDVDPSLVSVKQMSEEDLWRELIGVSFAHRQHGSHTTSPVSQSECRELIDQVSEVRSQLQQLRQNQVKKNEDSSEGDTTNEVQLLLSDVPMKILQQYSLIVYYFDVDSPNHSTIIGQLKDTVEIANRKASEQSAQSSKMCLITRPIHLRYSERPLQTVQGFGVEMAVKNMEYKVLDETESTTTVEVSDSGDTSTVTSQSSVNGTSFSTPVSIKLSSLIPSDAKHVLSIEDEGERKKHCTKIDVQTTFLLISHWRDLNDQIDDADESEMSNDELKRQRDLNFIEFWMDLSNNFPRYATQIVSIDEDRYSSIEGYLKNLDSMLGMHNSRGGMGGNVAGAGSKSAVQMVILNGINAGLLNAQASGMNVFEFIRQLKAELKYVAQLKQMVGSDDPLKNGLIRRLLETPLNHFASTKNAGGAAGRRNAQRRMMSMLGQGPSLLDFEEQGLRIDIHAIVNGDSSSMPKSGILWVNDIPRQLKYSVFSSDMMALQSFQAMRQVIPLRGNLYQMVVMVDLCQFYHWNLISTLIQLLEAKYPVRIGIVWIRNHETRYHPETSAWNLLISEQMCDALERGFFHISKLDPGSTHIPSEVAKLDHILNGLSYVQSVMIRLSAILSAKIEEEIEPKILKDLGVKDKREFEKMREDGSVESYAVIAEFSERMSEVWTNTDTISELIKGEFDETEHFVEVYTEYLVKLRQAEEEEESEEDPPTLASFKSSLTDESMKIKVDEYLKSSHAWIEAKGLNNFLFKGEKNVKSQRKDPLVVNSDGTTETDEMEDEEDEENGMMMGDDSAVSLFGSDTVVLINGRIFKDVSVEAFGNTMGVIEVLMEEQRQYLMAMYQRKLKRSVKKNNFDRWIYKHSGALPSFSKFQAWFNAVSPLKQVKSVSDQSLQKSGNTELQSEVLYLLHPTQVSYALRALDEGELVSNNNNDNNNEKGTMMTMDYHSLNQSLPVSVWVFSNQQSDYSQNTLSPLINTVTEMYLKLSQQRGTQNDESKPMDDGNNGQPNNNPDPLKPNVVISEFDLNKDFKRLFPNVEIIDRNENGECKDDCLVLFVNGMIVVIQGSNMEINSNDLKTLLDYLIDPVLSDITPELNRMYEDSNDYLICDPNNNGNNNNLEQCLKQTIGIASTLCHRRIIRGLIYPIALIDEAESHGIDGLVLSMGDSDRSLFSLRGVLDPLSFRVQSFVSLINKLMNEQLLDSHSGQSLLFCQFLLNPQLDINEDQLNKYGLPHSLAQYYRFVLNLPNDSNDGAQFVGLPGDTVLTMGVVDTPNTWLIESLFGTYDLDNFRLDHALELLSKKKKQQQQRNRVENDENQVLDIRYSLSHLLIQGQCLEYDLQKNRAALPTPGIQLVLTEGNNDDEIKSDTIVMQNHGYWQLKAFPGRWGIHLKQGRTTEVYSIRNDSLIVNSDDNNNNSNNNNNHDLNLMLNEIAQLSSVKFVDSWNEPYFSTYVTHNPGMEQAELYSNVTDTNEDDQKEETAEEEQSSAKDDTNNNEEEKKSSGATKGITDMISSLFGSSSNKDDNSDKDGSALSPSVSPSNLPKYPPRVRPGALPASDTTIHVMSVASGHLYERFLKIMMRSVLKSTQAKHVKFWFFGQFLSPRFKSFIPYFVNDYCNNDNNNNNQGRCSIELVDYRWPEWLRSQREKMRQVWAYKILFLDVLFPIDLERIIFVDADQIVREDLIELWNMDLEGKVYGYTPFCDSNLDTEGFRFWKQGYWKNHLRGKPYHISALYVVDLNQFRRRRSGDTLRSLYDQLSADPKSLSNLDQDLPNFAQHTVPIYSLPQSWLWCETWCSMDTLPTAKTIDLCNNPLTKEPKLEKAKRLIPEWTVFNDEVIAFDQKLISEGKLSED